MYCSASATLWIRSSCWMMVIAFHHGDAALNACCQRQNYTVPGEHGCVMYERCRWLGRRHRRCRGVSTKLSHAQQVLCRRAKSELRGRHHRQARRLSDTEWRTYLRQRALVGVEDV